MLPHRLNTVLRWSIVLSSLGFLGWKLLQADFQDYADDLIVFSSDPRLLLIPLMSVLNWGLEAEKWRLSLDGTSHFGRVTAFKAILSGCSVSFVTPNRTGEFLGRMYWLPQQKMGFSIPSSIVCSMNQLLVTLIAGSVALIMRNDILSQQNFRLMILLLALGLIVLLFILLYRIDWLAPLVRAFLSKRNLLPYFQYVIDLSSRVKFYLTGLSILRYSIFTLQFALILHWMGGVSWWYAINGVMLLFLFQTLLPSLTFAELGVRGSLVLLIFTGLCPDTILLFSTLLIWIFNLALPAIAGTLLLAFKS